MAPVLFLITYHILCICLWRIVVGLKVRIYSHCAELYVPPGDHNLRGIMDRFCNKWDQFQWVQKGKRFEKEFQARYIVVLNGHTLYRMHINQYNNEFKKYIQTFSYVEIEEKFVPPPVGAKVEIKIKDGWELKPKQIEPYQYVIADKPERKMLGSQPGAGKSFMSMKSMAHFGERVLMVFRASDIAKWGIDFDKTLDKEASDIMTVSGASEVKKLLSYTAETCPSKIIVISNSTYRSFISLYEKMGDRDFLKLGYACRPQDIWERLGIGYRIIDEVHLDFHFNFKLDCYTNVRHSLSMSGTLVTKNQFLHNMHNICYPYLERYIPPDYNKYINATSIFYRFRKPEKIRTSERGSNRYSHNALEESVMRHVPTKMNYMAMIERVMRITFFRKYKSGFKLIIYVFKVTLAEELAAFLKPKFANMKIGTYVQEDSYNEALEYDIIISNVIKAGTAKDIPNLFMVLQTISVDSPATNEQVIGRLREMKDGTNPLFAYLVCDDLKPHKQYHENKLPLLEKMCLNRNEIFIDQMI